MSYRANVLKTVFKIHHQTADLEAIQDFNVNGSNGKIGDQTVLDKVWHLRQSNTN